MLTLFLHSVPSFISTLVVTTFMWAYIGTSVPRGSSRYSAPSASPLQLLVYSLFITLIGLPVTILINRYRVTFFHINVPPHLSMFTVL